MCGLFTKPLRAVLRVHCRSVFMPACRAAFWSSQSARHALRPLKQMGTPYRRTSMPTVEPCCHSIRETPARRSLDGNGFEAHCTGSPARCGASAIRMLIANRTRHPRTANRGAIANTPHPGCRRRGAVPTRTAGAIRRIATAGAGERHTAIVASSRGATVHG